MSNTSVNVELQNLASVRVSKWDIECQNTIFDPSLNVEIGFLIHERQNTILSFSSNVNIEF